jgi:hypothetical protein
MQCVIVDPYTSPSFTLFEAYDYDMSVGKRKLKNHIDRMPFFLQNGYVYKDIVYNNANILR